MLLGSVKYMASRKRVSMSSPSEWLGRHAGYATYWRGFERFLVAREVDWRALLGKRPPEIRNLIDDYLAEISSRLTTKTVKTANSVIRSFFSYNDLVLPRSRLTLRGGKPMTIARLTPDVLRQIIMAAKPRDQSFLLFKFHSMQDNARMLWINKAAWSQIKPQLDQGGWRDRNNKLWENIMRIDIPLERKGNPRPYFCFIGKEAFEALQRHLNLQGEPDPTIWKGYGNIVTLARMMLRLGRRIGVIPNQSKAFDTSVRYGYNLHEMRDVAKSLWHESGADLLVADFCMGHTVDALGYDKVYQLSPDYAVRQFKAAEPYITLTEVRTTRESTRDMQELKDRLARLETIYMEKIRIKE